MAVDPNLPIPSYPILEPTSALDYGQLIAEVAYKIGCAYYGSDGTGAYQVPTNTHDLNLCQNIVNKAVRKFISDGPRPNGWRWLNVIAQVDLWPQISYDPTGATFVSLTANPTVGGVTYTGCTLMTLYTPPVPPYGTDAYPNGGPPQPNPLPTPPFGYTDGDTSYVPQFLSSMELRQIWLNGNPPPTTPGWYLPIDEDFTGFLLGTPWTILRYISPTQLIIDGNATLAVPVVTQNSIGWSSFATSGDGAFTISVTTATGGTQTTGSAVVPGQSALTIQNLITSLSNVGAGKATVTAISTNAAYPNGYNFSVKFASSVGFAYVSLAQYQTTLAGTQNSAPFSFACAGDYTLPANFGGQYTGQITYVANTNRGMVLQWTSEYAIRSRRQNYNIESGTPYEAAVRLMPTPSYQPLTNSAGFMLPRHRWELMTWRISSEFLSVLFPYTLSFNSLVNLTDVPPSPLGFDEALLACCRAVAEKEVDDTVQGVDWTYYHEMALPNAWQLDMRSAPKKLGYFGNPTSEGTANPIQAFRDIWYQRPTVPVFGTS
jgi:hypothetical protein